MKKVKKILTLSAYTFGRHIMDGRTPKEIAQDEDSQYASPSFRESFVPLHDMVESFKTLPTGTKIRVTMEVVK
jgi:hypothetical protein